MAGFLATEQPGSTLWHIDGCMPSQVGNELVQRCLHHEAAHISEIEIFHNSTGGVQTMIFGVAPLELIHEFVGICERFNRRVSERSGATQVRNYPT